MKDAQASRSRSQLSHNRTRQRTDTSQYHAVESFAEVIENGVVACQIADQKATAAPYEGAKQCGMASNPAPVLAARLLGRQEWSISRGRKIYQPTHFTIDRSFERAISDCAGPMRTSRRDSLGHNIRGNADVPFSGLRPSCLRAQQTRERN